jgi:RNA polymerase sigma factor (sigma-70 family)
MDDSELARIARTYGGSLARVAWGYVDNAADHDDLMQDVLVAIWRALPRFRQAASERTFVFRIAHNRGCTFAARRRRHEPLAAQARDPHPGPDERLDDARRRERLAAAIRTLQAPLRQAVLLRLEGFSVGEIAALQDTSENNVSVRLSRARDRLRAMLREGDA